MTADYICLLSTRPDNDDHQVTAFMPCVRLQGYTNGEQLLSVYDEASVNQ